MNEGSGRARCLLIIDSRTLERECLATTLTQNGLGMKACAVGSVAEWRRKKDATQRVKAVLLNITGRASGDGALYEEIASIATELAPAPVVILADGGDLHRDSPGDRAWRARLHPHLGGH